MKFAIYNDPGKKTSGQRFWSELTALLSAHPDHHEKDAAAIYFNISAPFSAVRRAKKQGRKIILRVDGIYHEKLTSAAIDALESPLARALFRLLYRVVGPAPWASFLMNLCSHNAKLLVKVWFADFVIYQSQFSRSLWQRYFPRKPAAVILNGAVAQPGSAPSRPHTPLRLVTTYDSWRPSKRLHELVEFIRWHNARSAPALELLLLGYDRKAHPPTLTAADIAWLEAGKGVEALPPFQDYTPEIRGRMQTQDVFITFSFRDNCPNVVVEAMSFGLPVVALDSGGIPEIVGDAGEVIPLEGLTDYFCAFDRTFDYPGFDRAQVSGALLRIAEHYADYRARVGRRFAAELEVRQVARKYLEVLRSF